MEEEKAKLIPLKRKKKTLVSKSGKGVVVKKPKGKSVVTVEILPEGSQTGDLSVAELKEQFDLNRVEQELLKLDKQKGFLENLFSSISDEQTLKRLKGKKETLELKRQIRDEIIAIEKQNMTVKIDFLDLKAVLLEKAVMSDERIQRVLFDIKLKELKSKKLEQDLKLLNLEQEIKEREKEGKDRGKSDSGGRYDMKDFGSLIESPDDKEDDEED